MAKEKQSEPDTGSLNLAERLFATHWRPNSGYGPEKVAVECIEAAAVFENVAKSHKPTAIPFAGAKAS